MDNPVQRLHEAVCADNQDSVKQMLADGVSADARDENGYVPLHHVRSKAMVGLLVSHGADIEADMNDGEGITPLCNSTMNGQVEIAEALLDDGANVNSRCGTALGWAAVYGQVEAIKLLLARDADVNLQDEQTPPPLFTAITADNASADESFQIASLLIAHGADVNSRDKSGRTPLHEAVDTYHAPNLKLVRLLLENGANPNLADESGLNPHAYAAKHGHSDAIELLQEFGAIG